jgi:hypothetical protein
MQMKNTAGKNAVFIQGLQVIVVCIHLVLPVIILLSGAIAHYAGWLA